MKKNHVKCIRLVAAIVASLLVTSVFRVIPTFSENSASSPSGPADIDVTHTLTPVQTWQEVYWYKNGCMLAGGRRAVYRFTLSLGRVDNNYMVPTLITVVGLKRLDLNNTNSATNTFYMSTQLLLLGPLETKSISLVWEEDGTYVAFFPANHTYTISALAFINSPSNAYDNDMTNNEVSWGTMRPEGPLIGDLQIDGTVNILDSIVLGLHFGEHQGDPGWDPNCDLKPDGYINILDAVVFGMNFGNIAPGPQF